jgi:hypothetical protein
VFTSHLGRKVLKRLAKKPFGRPKQIDEAGLLELEGRWIELFFHLKHGQPGYWSKRYGSSGIIVRAGGGQDAYYDSSSGEMVERKGRETITTSLAGGKPKSMRQPKFIESKEQEATWQKKVRETEELAQAIYMGRESIREYVPSTPSEQHLWEALKKAKTARQIRNACKRSRIWLIWRYQLPSGGFWDLSWLPIPKALYDHANQVCAAKLDSRYPAHDKRDSADYWRMEYLGRALAGLSLAKPISASYSVDVLRKLKHSKDCVCWRCELQIKPRFPRTLAQHLHERAQKQKTETALEEKFRM